jgi:uncharacterized caspase-like protein|tara:strand:- start:394 stop:1548 length:1155 start_codon:yes stop_codon:yes gene_type:complete
MLILFFAFGLAITTDEIYENNWALVIGINDYQNVRKLHYAVEDAMAIKNMLINEHGFPRDNVRYLIDESATQLRINKELSNLVKSVGKNDRVVFYFAGHGDTRSMGLEEGDIGFLIPVDGDPEDLFFSAIDMEQIKRHAKYSNAKHMLFLVDACYGGLAAVNTRSLSTSAPNFLDKIVQENARQIITAGGKDEEVIEKDEWQHSAFTKNILLGLRDKKADQNQDGFITGTELGLYVQENVSNETENAQTPQVKRLTIHDGEIIFHAKVESKKQIKDEPDRLERFEELLRQLNQQSQNKQVQINENQRVVKPGSMGLYRINPTTELKIIRVFYQPSGLTYEVKFKLSIGADDEWTKSGLIKIDDVLEIPGVTKYGIYNLTTGTVD